MLARSDIAAWWLVLVLGLVDALWVPHTPFSFLGIGPAAGCVAAFIGIALYCRRGGRIQRLGDLAHLLAQWFAFCIVLGILAYLAASIGAPLRDEQLARMDAFLGFDWAAMFGWLLAHPLPFLTLGMVYNTFIPQILGAIVFFSLAARSDRARELLWALMLSALATVAVAAALPAACACIELGTRPPEMFDHLADFTALRAGLPSAFVLSQSKGIVTFPSFHTVAAVLLIYAFRGRRWLFPGALLLNGLMLLSVPAIGGHYLVDVLAGIGIAGATIAALQGGRVLRRRGSLVVDEAEAAAYVAR